MSSVATLREDLPVGDVQYILICFIYEYHFCKWGNHGFVKCALPRDRCNVSVVHKSLDGEEQARFSTVCSSYKTRYFVLVLLRIVVQKSQEVFTKHCHFTCRQAVLQDFTKILRVSFCCGIVCTKASRRQLSYLPHFDGVFNKRTIFYRPAKTIVDFY